MPREPVAHLTRLLDPGTGVSDDTLLTRFIDKMDEEAFAELVRRYGPVVLGVCRRVLANPADAEDAFQTTFIVLARKAQKLVGRGSLGGWLHGVARRTVLKIRATAIRRKQVELTASRPEAIQPPDSPSDCLAVIEEEIGRLPEQYRGPLLLCGMCEQPRREVAIYLGIPEGTLASRLATARVMLADRLRRRGVMVPAGLLTIAAPVVSPELVTAATQAATGTAQPNVSKLASEVSRAMLLTKLRIAFLIVPVVLLCVAVAVSMGQWAEPEFTSIPKEESQPAPPPTTKKSAEKPTKVEGRLLVRNEDKLAFLSPKGEQLSELPKDKLYLHNYAISPNGKQIAFIADEKPAFDQDGNYRRHVIIRDFDSKNERTAEITAQNLVWTPDGKVLVVEAASFKDVRDRKFTTWLIDGKNKSRVDLPEGAQIFGVSPDGKTFLAVASAKKKLYLSTITHDGKVTDLTETSRLSGSFAKPRLSPDGVRILYLDVDADEKIEKDRLRFPRLFIYDTGTKKRERISDVPLDAFVQSFAWSPDSRRIAYTWKRMEPGTPLAQNLNDLKNPKKPTETESHLTVSDTNGANAKTILSAKGSSGLVVTLSDVDWR